MLACSLKIGKKAYMILLQESEIFSIRDETFISGDSKLYMLYQPKIKESKVITVIILIIREKNIRTDMRMDLLCTKDMLVMDIQEKTKGKWGKKVWIINVHNQKESGRILGKVNWRKIYKNNIIVAGDMNTHSKG
jgi:hypothetical protein